MAVGQSVGVAEAAVAAAAGSVAVGVVLTATDAVAVGVVLTATDAVAVGVAEAGPSGVADAVGVGVADGKPPPCGRCRNILVADTACVVAGPEADDVAEAEADGAAEAGPDVAQSPATLAVLKMLAPCGAISRATPTPSTAAARPIIATIRARD